MVEVSATYARAHLSSLVRRVEAGETIIITRRGTPAAKLMPFKQPPETITESRATHGQTDGAPSKSSLPCEARTRKKSAPRR